MFSLERTIAAAIAATSFRVEDRRNATHGLFHITSSGPRCGHFCVYPRNPTDDNFWYCNNNGLLFSRFSRSQNAFEPLMATPVAWLVNPAAPLANAITHTALMLNRSINADIEASILDMKRDAYEFGPFGRVAIVDELASASSLKFSSAGCVVVAANNVMTVEEIAALFQDANLFGFSALRFQTACGDFIIQVILQHPPCLRRVYVDAELKAKPLNAILDAAAASPYLEEVRLVQNLPIETWCTMTPNSNRCDDPHAPLKLVFSCDKDRLFTKCLQRSVQLVPLDESVLNEDLAVVGADQEETLSLSLQGIASPPLKQSALRFAPALAAMRQGLDSAIDAVVANADPKVQELPSTFINSAGRMELENRFTNIDIALCVLWLNKYACQETHDMLTQAAERRDPPPYFISLRGMAFFMTHVCSEGQLPFDNTRRCFSLLSAAHFLGITTLENLLMSLLIAPPAKTEGLLFSMHF